MSHQNVYCKVKKNCLIEITPRINKPSLSSKVWTKNYSLVFSSPGYHRFCFFFWGGGGVTDAFLSRFRPPADPKSPPLYYFEIFVFDWRLADMFGWLQNFLSAPLAPNYTNFPKKFSKRFFGLFFLKTCRRCRKFCQNVVFIVIRESSENQFGLPKNPPSSRT